MFGPASDRPSLIQGTKPIVLDLVYLDVLQNHIFSLYVWVFQLYKHVFLCCNIMLSLSPLKSSLAITYLSLPN